MRLLDQPGATRVQLSAPTTTVKRIHLRWRGNIDATRLVLGDAWERGYGDLEWRAFVPDRAMPWYFATYDGAVTHAYGVRTGANALCFWQADPGGISLWADVRSGGVGVKLGERTLDVCDVVSRAGHGNESAFAALHAFCKQMCASPRLPRQPVYGSNDWYWAYGKNSAATVLTDARNIVELSPRGTNRPFAVIDDGWQPGRGADKAGTGTWDRGNDKFPDMRSLAGEIKQIGARPGIWIRPLQAPTDAPDSWRLPREPKVLDPTVPAVLEKVADDISRIREWGYELIKHDYSTFDIFGRWGFQMGTALTRDGWTFAAGSARTTAEVINDLYRTIRVGGGRFARHRLQHREPSLGRRIRDLSNRRRHERNRMGAHAKDGREHAGVSRRAARRVLRCRSRLRRRHERDPVVVQQTVARSARAQWDDAVRLARARRAGGRAAPRSPRSARACCRARTDWASRSTGSARLSRRAGN